MKLLVQLLLIAAFCQADVQPGKTDQKRTEVKTDKRELSEGNDGLQKRTTVLSTASPGIQYADIKDNAQDTSPAQHTYATPVPQIAKISDVLTGHGAPFPVTIASHLLSPVSIYQPRFGSPTTYEVSAPVPSQLAYSEHKISYQAPQNAIQYFTTQRPYEFKQPFPRFTTTSNYNQQGFLTQNGYIQPQLQIYSQQPQQFTPQPQQSQRISQSIFQLQQFPGNYNPHIGYPQQSNQYYQGQIQAPAQNQIQQPLYYNQNQIIPQQLYQQPAVIFARQQDVSANNGFANIVYQQQYQQQQPAQRELQTQSGQTKSEQKQIQGSQNYDKSQGAVSYASFSQSSPNYVSSNSAPQVPLQTTKLEPQPASNFLPEPPKAPQQQLLLVRQGQLQNQPQPQFYQQPQFYPQGILIQNTGSVNQVPVAPNFPPVQYYGKFAESIFGNQYRQ